MAEQSIGNSGTGDEIQGGFGFYVPEMTGVPNPAVSILLNDSISISSASPVQIAAIDPMNPRLAAPSVNASDIAMKFQLGMAEIVTQMLTAWNKSLQDEAERTKAEINSPKYQNWLEQHSSSYIAQEKVRDGKDQVNPTIEATEKPNSVGSGTIYQAWLEQHSTNAIAKEQIRTESSSVSPPISAGEKSSASTSGAINESDKYAALTDRYAFILGMSSLLTNTIQQIDPSSASGPQNANARTVGVSGINSVDNAAAAAYASAMVATLAIGAGFASSFSSSQDVSSASQIEVKTIQDAWNQVNQGSDILTQTGGWFSAMWSIGLVYQLSAQKVAELGVGYEKGPHRQLEFAKGYAQELINSLEGNAFNINLLAILTPMVEKSRETQFRQSPETLALKGKLILLALALALVCKFEVKSKSETAKIPEEVFAAMLAGKIDFSKNDEFGTAEIKRQLVFYFNYTLQQLPESERVQVLEGILMYIGRDPDMEGFLDQQKAFSEILGDGEGTFEQSLFDKKPLDI